MVVSTPLHPIVEKALHDGAVETADGSRLKLHSNISRESCELIYRAAKTTNAQRAIEVGMAFGISTICLADAVRSNSPEGRLISIDPAQTTEWRGVALAQLERAELRGCVQLLEMPSHEALPKLSASGERVDLAFIDGWHTFDHTLVDFFFIDLMLHIGGILVFDDIGYPAINTVGRFVAANRDYEIWEVLQSGRTTTRHPFRSGAKRLLQRIARTDQDPSAADMRLFSTFKHAHTVAFRKIADDRRRYDHFRQF